MLINAAQRYAHQTARAYGHQTAGIPRISGSKTKRNARQVFEGVCRAKRT